MNPAADTFVVALARASKKARRHLRGLVSCDRDDVISAAILWCWANRARYDSAVPLEDWVMGAMRNARRDFHRGEGREAALQVELLSNGDDPAAIVESQLAARQLVIALGPENHKIASLRAQGYTAAEIGTRLDISARTVQSRLKGFKRLRHLLPDPREIRTAIRAATADSDHALHEPARIDHDIQRLEFAPPIGAKDCPPCWRCKYFEGYLPGKHRTHRHKIVDAEVAAAVLSTEAEKIRIATEVRG